MIQNINESIKLGLVLNKKCPLARKMRLGVLFSGGKDSCLALQRARKHHDIVCLISIRSKNAESYMFHTPNIHLVSLQAEAMDLPLVEVETVGVKEKELQDLQRAVEIAVDRHGVEGIVTGALASTYQSTRVRRICDELDLWCFNPLWMREPGDILREVVELGYKVVISGVFAYPLPKEYLGSIIDEGMVGELLKMERRYKINPAGEGGELETTVLGGPGFSARIEILETEIEYKNYSGILRVKRARMVEE